MFNTTVHRVQLNTKGSKATGVVLMNGTLVKARREVIVAAGSLLSPKILELSGIGQRTVLNDAGIKLSNSLGLAKTYRIIFESKQHTNSNPMYLG